MPIWKGSLSKSFSLNRNNKTPYLKKDMALLILSERTNYSGISKPMWDFDQKEKSAFQYDQLDQFQRFHANPFKVKVLPLKVSKNKGI